MRLITADIRARLLANGRRSASGEDHDPTDANATWLLTELDPMEPDRAFGLCDLGLGFPELGYVSIAELESLRGPLGLWVERDLHFSARQTLSAYARDARQARTVHA
jgi:hypothetical protein